MNPANSSNQEFIQYLTDIIHANLEKEHFGVNELAKEIGMTSSALRRKLHIISKKSINQLIKEVRLYKAMELLQNDNVTASEVAYKTGFSSPSYFNKCFHDHFGFPPGEAKYRENEMVKKNHNLELPIEKRSFPKVSLYIVGIVLALFITFIFFKKQAFKNIPILSENKSNNKEKSIIVIPFKSLNNGEDNLHFAEGITENIQSNLIHIKEFKVLAVNPIIKQSENQIDIESIAKELSVHYILTGSVQASNNEVLVMVQLIDTKQNQHIWSKDYNKELTDIFFIQSDIAQQVAAQLKTVLTATEKKEIERVPTRNTEAYSAYLKGRYFLHRRVNNGFTLSGQYFERAIKADPDFAEAYVGLADSYIALATSRYYTEKEEAFNTARELAQKALEKNPDLAYAHAILGAVYYKYQRDWEKARKELKLAVQLNPNSVMSHLYYSEFLIITGELKESRLHCNKALELNPTSWRLLASSIELYAIEGNYTKALEQCLKLEELFPDFFAVYWRYWAIYYYLEEHKKAVNALQKALSYFQNNDKYTNSIQAIFNHSGIQGVLNMLLEYHETDSFPTSNQQAKIYTWLGEKEKALLYFNKALDEQPYNLPPRLRSKHNQYLYDEPEFKILLNKLNLTPYFKDTQKKKNPE